MAIKQISVSDLLISHIITDYYCHLPENGLNTLNQMDRSTAPQSLPCSFTNLLGYAITLPFEPLCLTPTD